jgi:hypothetical protein
MCIALLKIAQRFNAGVDHPDKIESRSGKKGAPANKHGSVDPDGTLDLIVIETQPRRSGAGLFSDEGDAKHVLCMSVLKTE